jgi:Fur family ferric uptake transcriptional regulator
MVVKKQTLKINRKALSSAGLRMTRQRALILEIIRHGHLDADEVYRQAREKQPRFSLSTVYRTLRMLKEQGLVDELHFGEAHHHYEVKPSAEHHHLVCLGCGKIVEFECKLSQRMKQDLARKQGFEVTGVEINMTGYCSKCRQRRE